MKRNKKESLPKRFNSIDEAAEFWDTHDLSDYWKYTKPIKAQIKIKASPRYLLVEEHIAQALARIAKKKKIPAEVIANLWLREKVSKVS